MTDDLREFSAAARQVVNGLGTAASEQEAWALVSELGWLLTTIPEEHGGLGMGLPGACTLLQELGRGVSPVPLLSALLGADVLCQGDLTARQSLLDQLGAGAAYIAVSLAGSSLVVEESGDLSISGMVSAVPSADKASHLLLWSAAADAVVLVQPGQAGVSLEQRPAWDSSQRLFELSLENTVIEPNNILARGEQAQLLVERMLCWRDFALAAQSVGTAAALLEETIEYLKTRRQFGRPLAMFQALKHRCADLQALVEAADALLQSGLATATADTYELQAGTAATHAALAAKQLASEAAATVAEESLQLHGGIGMTEEHLCHRYLKRALLDEHLGRGGDSYQILLADELLASA